jgi:imidazolonepropionase-like amidohydrolase
MMRHRAAVLFSVLISIFSPVVYAADTLISPALLWTGEGRAHRLPGKTLIPGLIDLHSHVLLHPYNETTWDDQVIKEAVGLPHRAGRAPRRRHPAGRLHHPARPRHRRRDYADVGIKRAIDEGKVPGPRLLVATRAIVATASYGPAERSYRPDMEIPYGAQQATGVDEGTRAVREQARTAPTGSSSTPTTAPASTAAPAPPSRWRK